jgi:hypothetical protein
VRPRKLSALLKPSLLLELASNSAMGIASGLAFAFLVTHIGALGFATLMSYSPNPPATLLTFAGTCATTFGIGAALTGVLFRLAEDDGTHDCK